jgi:glutathione peroxidase
MPSASGVMPGSLFEIDVTSWDGTTVSMERYRGQVMLIVNVASRCGFTPQYAGLEALYRKYKDRGFVVLGFPCNQFAGQEPAAEPEIHAFCLGTYGVTFPLFAKVAVNGAHTHPLFRFLKARQRGVGSRAIKWNFTKFLVDRSGGVIARFSPSTTPEAIEPRVAGVI